MRHMTATTYLTGAATDPMRVRGDAEALVVVAKSALDAPITIIALNRRRFRGEQFRVINQI